jgi:F-type H+-transporting ATPase subunit b
MTTAGIFLLPNGTFFIELAVSIVLILLIYKYVIPPINKAMEDRQEKIRTSLEAADQARADAEAADDQRRAVLDEARQQAREIVAQARGTAETVRADAQTRAQSESERILANADVEVGLARQRAVEEAASRMGQIVMDVVERVVGREISAEAHQDLIDSAVAALRADTAAGGGAPDPAASAEALR